MSDEPVVPTIRIIVELEASSVWFEIGAAARDDESLARVVDWAGRPQVRERLLQIVDLLTGEQH